MFLSTSFWNCWMMSTLLCFVHPHSCMPSIFVCTASAYCVSTWPICLPCASTFSVLINKCTKNVRVQDTRPADFYRTEHPSNSPREDSQAVLSTVPQFCQPPMRFPFSAAVHSITNWQPTQWKNTIIQEVKMDELFTSDTTRAHSLYSYMLLLLYDGERKAAHVLPGHAQYAQEMRHVCKILDEKPKCCITLQTATMKWKCVSLLQVLMVLIGLI